jgi:hypothetical integral membrane protein (TIGR02206 family)
MNKEFVIFGADHLIALLLVAVGSAAAFRAGQSRAAGVANTVGGVLFSALAIALWLFRLENGFQAKDDLPLSLCDLAFLLCVACFLRPNDLMLTLVAYWGLAGTLQALITPDVLQAFPSKEFLLFFVGHSVIVVCVFFLLGKNRPARLAGPHGVAVAFGGLLAYTAIVGAADAAFGWNYGYLMAKPAGASVLDSMGPWPVYVGAGLVLALILFFAVAGLLKLLWKIFPGADRDH